MLGLNCLFRLPRSAAIERGGRAGARTAGSTSCLCRFRCRLCVSFRVSISYRPHFSVAPNSFQLTRPVTPVKAATAPTCALGVKIFLKKSPPPPRPPRPPRPSQTRARISAIGTRGLTGLAGRLLCDLRRPGRSALSATADAEIESPYVTGYESSLRAVPARSPVGDEADSRAVPARSPVGDEAASRAVPARSLVGDGVSSAESSVCSESSKSASRSSESASSVSVSEPESGLATCPSPRPAFVGDERDRASCWGGDVMIW
jgi:hypothetical protein